ncbi:Hypothetical protein D9617_77g092420 [Elsinoe fawcettii]|nr:Hypothetical protein D9617_77g092420 [Elsinoe fawcettii]
MHWYHLSRLHDCLNLFHVATLEIEGNGALFYDWFLQLSWLLDELDNWRVDFAEEASRDSTFAALSDAVSQAWSKCEKYYKLADETPFSYAAVILNPTMKMQWFIDRWACGTAEPRTWIPQVEEQVRRHWLQFYKHRDKGSTLPSSSSKRVSPAAGSSAGSDDLRELLRVYKRVKLDDEVLLDDVDEMWTYQHASSRLLGLNGRRFSLIHELNLKYLENTSTVPLPVAHNPRLRLVTVPDSRVQSCGTTLAKGLE